LLCHALAVAHAREQDMRGYHFMAGDGRYKTSLSNATEHLSWITLRRDDPRSRLEDRLDSAKTAIIGRLKAWRSSRP